jgi:ABC-type multidrug transport system fused ATPase/permease subunit
MVIIIMVVVVVVIIMVITVITVIVVITIIMTTVTIITLLLLLFLLLFIIIIITIIIPHLRQRPKGLLWEAPVSCQEREVPREEVKRVALAGGVIAELLPKMPGQLPINPDPLLRRRIPRLILLSRWDPTW